jgi:hypothetical protein
VFYGWHGAPRKSAGGVREWPKPNAATDDIRDKKIRQQTDFTLVSFVSGYYNVDRKSIIF